MLVMDRWERNSFMQCCVRRIVLYAAYRSLFLPRLPAKIKVSVIQIPFGILYSNRLEHYTLKISVLDFAVSVCVYRKKGHISFYWLFFRTWRPDRESIKSWRTTFIITVRTWSQCSYWKCDNRSGPPSSAEDRTFEIHRPLLTVASGRSVFSCNG